MPTVLLINPSFLPKGSRFAPQTTPLTPPLGLLAVASSLTAAGLDVDLIDPQLDQDYLTHVAEAVARGPVFVGMTTFMGPNIINARTISATVKTLSPATPVVWGGPLATSVPEMCFGDPSVDFVVMGMGEETAPRLAEALLEGRDPTALAHVVSRSSDGGRLGQTYCFQGSLDDLLFPQLDLWEAGIRRMSQIPILSSRGCPRNCAFCYNNTFMGRKRWYGRSTQNVLTEMDHWAARFDMDRFHFVDDNFLVDTRRACQIMDASRARGYRLDQLLGHLVDFKPPILERLDGYVDHVHFSIESASPRIQQLLNKPVDRGRALEMIRTFSGKGIAKITTNFMFGLPTETDDDIAASLSLAVAIRALDPMVRIVPYLYGPQPKDDIVTRFDFYERMPFSLGTLSEVDITPNRSRILEADLHPWMTAEDREFYLDLIQLWFYHFDHVVRVDQDIAVDEIMARSARLRSLFASVPPPR
jgi:radical SAM superfamily enzyme YgiQ (UPF0313 family)